jgi:hypothetical protein
MQIVWLVEEMDGQGVFIGSYWFTSYMIFFAVISLCMFVLGSANEMFVDEAVTAAEKGRKILAKLSAESQSATMCSAGLEVWLS